MANNDFSARSGELASNLSDAATRAQEQAAAYGQRAVEAIDSRRATAAQGLDAAAQQIHEQADALPGGEQVSEFAHRTANKLGATADYLRNHDVRDIADDVQRLIKEYPAQALIGAAVVGFLAGRALRMD